MHELSAHIDLSPKGLAELRNRLDAAFFVNFQTSFNVVMSLIAEIERLRVENAQLRRSI
jgi:hypothetical protein